MTTSDDQGRPDGAALALAKEIEQLRHGLRRVEQTAAAAKDTAETAVRAAARNVGVAERVDSLRAQLAEMVVQLGAVTTAVNGVVGLARQVTTLSEQVTALAERLGGAEGDDDESEPAEPALPSWFEADPEQAEAMLLDLAEWVDTILVRHQVAREGLSECWMLHGELVEDLLWLRAAWRAAHRDPAAKPHHAADFHERWLPAVMSRYRRQMGSGGCHFDNHRADGGDFKVRDDRHPHEQVPVTDQDLASAYARWWAQHRGLGDVDPPGVPARHRPVPRSQYG